MNFTGFPSIFLVALFFAMSACTVMAVPSHQAWNSQLQRYVSANGAVNYPAWKNNVSDLQAYLLELEADPPKENWSRNDKLAYWINAYNAYTVKLILDNFPLKSITNLSNPWDKKFITIDSKSYSLNDIEHGIIREKFKDARIHFAVNCASQSCPPLLNKAFTGTNVELLLAQQTRKFINDPRHNSIAASQISISKIFDWYREDFEKDGSVIDFLNKYSSTKISADATTSYKDYDWALNQ